MNHSQIARRVGVSRQAVIRWSKVGLTIEAADKLAVALGKTPEIVWGPEYDSAHCHRGHEWDGHLSHGRRRCRVCEQERESQRPRSGQLQHGRAGVAQLLEAS